MRIAEIIDLKRYPLHQPGSEKHAALVESVRSALRTAGSCTLSDFVLDTALEKMVREAESLVDLSFPGPTAVSPYFFNYKIGAQLRVGRDHPTRRKGRRNLRQVAADLIPPGHLLSRLYRSKLMIDFLSAVLGEPVYRNQDKYQSLNISVMDQGGCQQWHFDGGNMVTTLLVQAPEAGGEFQYVPNIRSDQDENFDRVRDVLDGDASGVQTLSLKAGTLSLFRGHYSLHRVTEVTGDKQRLQAILGYTTHAGWVGSLESSILHYGPRVAEIESVSANTE